MKLELLIESVAGEARVLVPASHRPAALPGECQETCAEVALAHRRRASLPALPVLPVLPGDRRVAERAAT